MNLRQKAIFAILSTILLFIPSLFWFNNLYNVGGDDTGLYYMFPVQMIRSYIFNIISDNGLSAIGTYLAQWYQLPFYTLIACVKFITPFVNTQGLFYGLNLVGGFIFFYMFLGIWLDSKKENFYIKTVSSLIYVFSIFSFYTLWSGLFVGYLIAIFPLAVYLFVRSVLSNNYYLLFLCAIVLSLFSILILSTPWFLLAILATAPVIIFTLNTFVKRILFFGCILILLLFLFNFYWLFHLLYPYFVPVDTGRNDLLTTLSSTNSVSEAEIIIHSVVGLNNLIYPLFNLFHKGIQEAYGWQNYKIFTSWHEKFLLPYSFFLIIMVVPALLLKRAAVRFKRLYISLLSSWLFLVYIFTVKIGDNFGISLFLFLNKYIPGFIMFRNNYSKISPAIPFIYAFLLCISVKILFDHVKNKIARISVLLFLFFVTLLNARPFIVGDYFKNPVWTTKQTYTTISDFNADFYSLTKYLSTLDTIDHIAWVPISTFGYVFIQDKHLENHYYTGLSPIQFLSKKTDLAGVAILPTSTTFREYYIQKRYTDIAKQYQKFNVNYLIVNNDISKELQNSYHFTLALSGDLYSNQSNEFKDVVLGKKIASFGKRYDLYEIKDEYKSKKIYITDNKDLFPLTSDITYKKISSAVYEIRINHLKQPTNLVFLETYSSYWDLYVNTSPFIQLPSQHSRIFNYANSWQIDPDLVKKEVNPKFYEVNNDGSINIKLTLYFKPQKYFKLGFLVSGFSILLSSSILLFVKVKRIKLP